jgi:phosphate starvation-inducible membrane PsiE
MDTGTAVVATGLIVAVGHFAKDQQIPVRVFVGVGIYAVILAMLQQGNEELAAKFALLVLLAALFLYTIPIARKAGFTN